MQNKTKQQNKQKSISSFLERLFTTNLAKPVRSRRTGGVEGLDHARVRQVRAAAQINEVSISVNRRAPPIRYPGLDELPVKQGAILGKREKSIHKATTKSGSGRVPRDSSFWNMIVSLKNTLSLLSFEKKRDNM